MKRGLRNEKAEKMLNKAIFKLLVLSYMHTTLYISFFYSDNINKFYSRSAEIQTGPKS